VADAALISPRLRDETALVMRMVNLGRAAREKAQIRVRQPLATLFVRVGNEAEREALERLGDQVLEELNVKQLEFLAEGSDMLLFTVQPKMAALGPKLGKLLPKTLAALRSGDMQAYARSLLEDGKLTLTVEEQPVTLTFEDLDVEASAREGFVAAEERGYVALLDTTLTPDLLAEGAVRDLTRLIQDARKGAGLAVEDTIELEVWTDAGLAGVIERHAGYIREETLAVALRVTPELLPAADRTPDNGWYVENIPSAKLGDHEAVVRLRARRT
jgi:isoleucyl-tRNA synthetase